MIKIKFASATQAMGAVRKMRRLGFETHMARAKGELGEMGCGYILRVEECYLERLLSLCNENGYRYRVMGEEIL